MWVRYEWAKGSPDDSVRVEIKPRIRLPELKNRSAKEVAIYIRSLLWHYKTYPEMAEDVITAIQFTIISDGKETPLFDKYGEALPISVDAMQKALELEEKVRLDRLKPIEEQAGYKTDVSKDFIGYFGELDMSPPDEVSFGAKNVFIKNA